MITLSAAIAPATLTFASDSTSTNSSATSQKSDSVITSEANDNVDLNLDTAINEALEAPHQIPEGFTEQDIAKIAEDLEFYFTKAGTIDESGTYKVTNPELIFERGEAGDAEAFKLYVALFGDRSDNELINYAACVVVGTTPIFGSISMVADMIRDEATGKFMKILKTGSSWAIATAIAKLVSKFAGFVGSNMTVAGLIVGLVASLVSCA
jgi:hypothetical protein